MEEVDRVFTLFAAAGAKYSICLNQHLLAAMTVGTVAHRGTGTMAYRKAEWAQRDIDRAAVLLDSLGRDFVAELMKLLRGNVSCEEYVYEPSAFSTYLVRISADGSSTLYHPSKENEVPTTAVTPLEWLELVNAFPTIRKALSVG